MTRKIKALGKNKNSHTPLIQLDVTIRTDGLTHSEIESKVNVLKDQLFQLLNEHFYYAEITIT